MLQSFVNISRVKNLILAGLLFCLTIIFTSCSVPNLVFFYQMPSFSGANGCNTLMQSAPNSCGINTSSVPTDKPYCWMYGNGPSSALTPSPEQVGDFTGLYPPPPVSTYQYGLIDPANGKTWYGASTCQLSGTSAGAIINTQLSAVQRTEANATYYGWGVDRFWSQNACSVSIAQYTVLCEPWNPLFNPQNLRDGPYFRLQTYWDEHWFNTSSSSVVAYSQICAYFYDTVNTHTIAWCPNAWDSRGASAPTDAIIPDFGQNTAPIDIVLTYFGKDAKYATLHCLSQTRGQTNPNAAAPDWYAAYLPWTQFQTVLTALNQSYIQHGMPLAKPFDTSTPTDYQLTGVIAGSEIYDPPQNGRSPQASFGSKVASVMAMDDTSPCLA